MSKQSVSTPYCCKAGAYGMNGGAIHATHFFDMVGAGCVNDARAGISKVSSPIP